MINIAVVEDDIEQINDFNALIKRYNDESNIKCLARTFNDGINFIDEYPKDLDILFLDIQMKHMDGLSVARKVRTFDERVLIVFTTNMCQYAIDGYSVNATNYLMKPLDYGMVKKELNWAITKLRCKPDSFLTVKNNSGIFVVAVPDIEFIETRDRRLYIHTPDRIVVSKHPLRYYEKTLNQHYFYRCHTSYIVNIEKITQCKGSSLMIGSEEIPISKYRKKDFMDAFIAYLEQDV